MRFAANFLPPWYPVETQETEEGLRNWIGTYLPTTQALTGLTFTVIGVCRARVEMAIRLHDGRVAIAVLPDDPGAPPSKEDPLEIYFFDSVEGLNRFIANDAAEHQ